MIYAAMYPKTDLKTWERLLKVCDQAMTCAQSDPPEGLETVVDRWCEGNPGLDRSHTGDLQKGAVSQRFVDGEFCEEERLSAKFDGNVVEGRLYHNKGRYYPAGERVEHLNFQLDRRGPELSWVAPISMEST